MKNSSHRYSFRSAKLYFQLFMFIFVPLSIAYAIYTRTLEDFLSYGGLIAAFLFWAVVSWLPLVRFRMTFKEGIRLRPLSTKTVAIFICGAALLSVLMGSLYYSLAIFLIDAWGTFKNWDALIAQRPFAIATGTLVVLTIGLLFFWLRLRARFLYGASEALAGVAFAVSRIANERVISFPSDDSFYFAILTAGVYLIVRGLDNMHHAWKDQKDPVARAFFWLGTESEFVATPPRRLKASRLIKKQRRQKNQGQTLIKKPRTGLFDS